MKLVGRLGWAMFGLYLLATYGCATSGTVYQAFPSQADEVAIAWASYGRTDAPPEIRWVTDLPCIDPTSNKRGFWITEADNRDGEGYTRCREGFTMAFDWVLVAYHGEASIADTAATHELLHVALLREGIFVGHHQRPDFFHRIDVANESIRARR